LVASSPPLALEPPLVSGSYLVGTKCLDWGYNTQERKKERERGGGERRKGEEVRGGGVGGGRGTLASFK